VQVDPRLTQISDCLYRVAAKALIIRDHKLLLVNESHHGWWGLPGGGIEYGEHPHATLARELHEELGLAPDQFRVAEDIISVNVGQLIDDIPRLALYYSAELSAELPMQGTLSFQWANAEQFDSLYISPQLEPARPWIMKLLAD
jgi:8-oxo-dGTP pyrophosphatase MutT (NUDIX family)